MNEITITDVFRYYIVWNDIEAKFEHEKENEYSFKKYLYYMGIIRNFRTNSSSEILSKVKSFQIKDPTKRVNDFSTILHESKLLNNRITKALVASSKILWLFHNDIIIMDNFNILSLRSFGHKVENGNYQEYCLAWESEYQKSNSKINESINKSLINDNIVKEEWFKRRIFDLYLWNCHFQKIRLE